MIIIVIIVIIPSTIKVIALTEKPTLSYIVFANAHSRPRQLSYWTWLWECTSVNKLLVNQGTAPKCLWNHFFIARETVIMIIAVMSPRNNNNNKQHRTLFLRWFFCETSVSVCVIIMHYVVSFEHQWKFHPWIILRWRWWW